MKLLLWIGVILSLAPAASAQDASEGGDLLSSLEERYRRVAERAESVTVAVWVDREEEGGKEEPSPFPNIPMMTGGVFSRRPKDHPASGLVFDSSGLILTTAFNVTGGRVQSIRVILPDGTEEEAEVVGFHEMYDVALLRVEAKGLPTLAGADLDRLRPGTPVVAAGRAPDGRGLTITPGIFSAPGRDAGRTLQTDCRLNYGSVGGPLLDIDGNLIGVTCKVRTRDAATLGQNSGVSFAVPWEKVKEILPDLLRGVKIEEAKGAFLGVSGRDWEDGEGAEITEVLGGTAAQRAGLEAGDVVVEFDGVRVIGMDPLREQILKRKVGDRVKLKYLRNGEEKELEVMLGERAGS